MWKIIISLVIGGAIGAGGGFAIGIFVYPYIFLADIEGTDEAPDSADVRLIADGAFIHADKSDPIHYGKGAVSVFEDVVHLNANFQVGPGPAYHVYLVPLDEVTPSTEVDKTMYVDLGSLRAFKGGQNYRIPAGTDLQDYKSVVIWCERFGVLISPAKLAFKGN